MLLQIVLLILGFILLIKGADLLVEGSSRIAKKFHIPELVIGLTVVSIGTSMPELMVSVTSAVKGFSDMSIGNIIGSNISNLLLILGTCAIVNRLIFKKETKFFESPFAFLVTILLFCMANNHIGGEANTITRVEGIVLLVLAVAFIIYNIIMAKKGEGFDGINKDLVIVDIKMNRKSYIVKGIIFIILGIVGLKFGGDFVVNSASEIAKAFGMSEKLISLTIIAVGTSLPELVTSIVATKKGEVDLAIGNIIGSCIFNIVLIIGVSAVITPISYSVSFNKDMIILLVATLFLGLFPFIGKKDEMTRFNGAIYFIGYVAYITNLIITNL